MLSNTIYFDFDQDNLVMIIKLFNLITYESQNLQCFGKP